MYASNSAAVRYYSLAVAPGRGSRSGTAVAHAVKPSFDDLLRLAEQNDPKAMEALRRMAHYLGVGIAQLVSGLAPDVITVIGEVTRVWPQIGSIVEEVVRQRSRTQAATRIVPTDPSAQPRLRGTIALVLQKHFWAPVFA
jgi:glucokinase